MLQRWPGTVKIPGSIPMTTKTKIKGLPTLRDAGKKSRHKIGLKATKAHPSLTATIKQHQPWSLQH